MHILHILFSLLMGLLVSLNPCQIAINLSAITFMGGRHVYVYTLGRSIMYILLSVCISLVLVTGPSAAVFINADNGSNAFTEMVETVLPYILIVIGIYLIFRALRPHHDHGDSCHHSGSIIHNPRRFPPFVLGLLLAVAFCPESIIMFLSVFSSTGQPTSSAQHLNWLIMSGLLFTVGASIPVLLFGLILEKSRKQIERVQMCMESIQRWLNLSMAMILITLAIIIICE